MTDIKICLNVWVLQQSVQTFNLHYATHMYISKKSKIIFVLVFLDLYLQKKFILLNLRNIIQCNITTISITVYLNFPFTSDNFWWISLCGPNVGIWLLSTLIAWLCW